MLDFAMVPPEITSARIYTGAGSGPLLAAATAWGTLAAQLRSTALSYGSVISELAGNWWRGPAAASMTAAAAPFVAWMSATATRVEQTAAQAKAAAAAYESAFAATVPPAVIAANRAQLLSLIATNVLGQNAPAIAANEAHYGQMWAQDAATMYGYAGSSATATQLTPFTPATQTANSGGLAGQAAAVSQAVGTSAGSQQATLSQLTSAVPAALQGLASPATLTSSGSNLDSILAPDSNFWNTITSTGAFNPIQIVQAVTSSSFLGAGANTMGQAGSLSETPPLAVTGGLGAGASGFSGLSGLGSPGSAVSAGLGRAASVGPLSVPPSWTSIAPASTPLATALGSTPLTAPEAVPPAMPGMPFGGMAVNGAARAVPQYGFRPTVVARPPAAG